MKRLIALLLIAAVVLTGCSTGSKSVSIGYDIPNDAANIDPQFATDLTAKIIVTNIFEGLVVQNSKGEILPGVAKTWDISSDGLTYSFHLRDNAIWNKEKDNDKAVPVTAGDFRFAFLRIFNPDAPSPYYESFLNIKNAEDIINDKISEDNLGVRAVSDKELVIELNKKDDFFLDKLALTAAMPCNEDFFNKTGGRYGLERKLILGNGPFYMGYWETDYRITLRANPEYLGESPVQISSVDFYIGRDDTESRFLNGKTDLFFFESSKNVKTLKEDTYRVEEYTGTIWSIIFNMSDSEWGAVPLRQSLAYMIDRDKINKYIEQIYKGESTEPDYKTVNSIFTEDILNEKFKGMGLENNPIEYNQSLGQKRYKEALEAVGLNRIIYTMLYYPDEGIHDDVLILLQEFWKKGSLSIATSGITAEEYENFLKAEDFQIALYPIQPESSGPQGMLDQFKTGSAIPEMNYNNPVYDNLLIKAESSNGLEEKVKYYSQAENLLLNDAVVIPLYSEKNYYAVSKEAEDIDVYPYDGLIRFHKQG